MLLQPAWLHFIHSNENAVRKDLQQLLQYQNRMQNATFSLHDSFRSSVTAGLFLRMLRMLNIRFPC